MGKLSKIRTQENNRLEDTTAMKDGVDVGFTKDVSAGSVIGNKGMAGGGILASDTEESVKLRQKNTGPQIIDKTSADLLKNDEEALGQNGAASQHPEFSFQSSRGDE